MSWFSKKKKEVKKEIVLTEKDTNVLMSLTLKHCSNGQVVELQSENNFGFTWDTDDKYERIMIKQKMDYDCNKYVAKGYFYGYSVVSLNWEVKKILR